MKLNAVLAVSPVASLPESRVESLVESPVVSPPEFRVESLAVSLAESLAALPVVSLVVPLAVSPVVSPPKFRVESLVESLAVSLLVSLLESRVEERHFGVAPAKLPGAHRPASWLGETKCCCKRMLADSKLAAVLSAQYIS